MEFFRRPRAACGRTFRGIAWKVLSFVSHFAALDHHIMCIALSLHIDLAKSEPGMLSCLNVLLAGENTSAKSIGFHAELAEFH
jgi:hypothetical protein